MTALKLIISLFGLIALLFLGLSFWALFQDSPRVEIAALSIAAGLISLMLYSLFGGLFLIRTTKQ